MPANIETQHMNAFHQSIKFQAGWLCVCIEREHCPNATIVSCEKIRTPGDSGYIDSASISGGFRNCVCPNRGTFEQTRIAIVLILDKILWAHVSMQSIGWCLCVPRLPHCVL